jgi:hypothetical protein
VAVRDYEAIFVGGGLAAMLLVRELGSALSGRVAVVDPCPPQEKPTVHWSYWSHGPTLYDRFAVGSWQYARVAQTPAESVAPCTLRLVSSTDVFDHTAEELRTVPIEWLRKFRVPRVSGPRRGRYLQQTQWRYTSTVRDANCQGRRVFRRSAGGPARRTDPGRP